MVALLVCESWICAALLKWPWSEQELRAESHLKKLSVENETQLPFTNKSRYSFTKWLIPKWNPTNWENKLSSLFPRRMFMQAMIIFPNQSSWSGLGWCGITAESGQFQVEKIANYGDFFPCPIFSLCVSVLSVKNAPFDMARSITVRLRISRKKVAIV